MRLKYRIGHRGPLRIIQGEYGNPPILQQNVYMPGGFLTVDRGENKARQLRLQPDLFPTGDQHPRILRRLYRQLIAAAGDHRHLKAADAAQRQPAKAGIGPVIQGGLVVPVIRV